MRDDDNSYSVGVNVAGEVNTATFAGYPIVVKIEPGLDFHTIEHIQLIEKQIDAALLPCGYVRSTTSKACGRVVFNYRQIAIVERG